MLLVRSTSRKRRVVDISIALEEIIGSKSLWMHKQKLQLEEAYTYIERSRRKFIHSSIPDEGVIAVKALFLSVSISQMQFKNEFY